jgi:RHS repeat-associated protein
VDAAWDQVSTVGAQTSASTKQPPHDFLTKTAAAKEAGFAYVFVSNEHPYAVDVYFDDVTVSQTPSPIVGSNDYYPFGLAFNSYQRENSTENKYLYNQGTGEKTFRTERQFDLGLNVDQSKYRTYDYLTGRWWQVDPKADEGDLASLTPYNFSYDNPVRYSDPEGDCPTCDPFFNAGVAVGAFDALKSTVTGALNFLSNVSNPAGQVEMAVNTAMTVQAIADNPGAAVDAVVDGVKSTANTIVNGTSFEQGQIVGGAAVAVAELAVGTKGAANLLKGTKAAEGIVYLRTDKAAGGLKPYVGQAKSAERFAARQKEHARANPNSRFQFKEIDKGKPGKDLNKKEQKALDARGGPTNKSNPNGGTSNKKNVIKKED